MSWITYYILFRLPDWLSNNRSQRKQPPNPLGCLVALVVGAVVLAYFSIEHPIWHDLPDDQAARLQVVHPTLSRDGCLRVVCPMAQIGS